MKKYKLLPVKGFKVSKKFRLLRDLPYAKAGEVFEGRGFTKEVVNIEGIHYEAANLPEWFEEVDGRWNPSIGFGYWTVNNFNTQSVEEYIWDGRGFDSRNYEFGLCFKTEKQAKAAAKGVKEYLLNRDE